MDGSWTETTVGEIMTFLYGKGLPEDLRNQNGKVPVYGSNGIVGFHDDPITDGPTVIIGRKGSIGSVHYSSIPCWPIDTTFYVTAHDPLQVRYYYFLLKSLDLEHMNTDSAVPGLNRSAAHARRINIPRMQSEQRAIAHILGTLDDKIDLNRRMSATLEAMARALFRAWFIDFEPVRAKQSGRWRRGESLPGLPAALFDRFPDRLVPSALGEIPEGWGVVALREMLELAYGKALKEEKRKIGDVAVYGSNGRVGWHNEALVRGPGIVVGRKGNPGTVTWAPSDFFVIDTAFYVLPRKLCQSLYFLFFALSNQDLASLATDSAVPGLNRNFVYQNLQVFPSLQVIKIFDQSVEAIFLQLYQLDRESRTLAALRDALLPKLISGALRVADAERFLRERGVG